MGVLVIVRGKRSAIMPQLPPALPPEVLRRICDPANFDFETTASLPNVQEVLGQPRAVAALEFGVGMASHGFNLFALGLPGSGKTTLIREYLERRAIDQPVPPDLCYVDNFKDARRPIALSFPAGHAHELKRAVDALIDELRAAIPKSFEAKEYENRRDEIMHQMETSVAEEFARLEQHVKKGGFQLVPTSGGMLLVPAINGRPVSEAELEALSEEQRNKLIQIRERLGEDVENSLQRKRELEKTTREALRQLDTETATFATQRIVNEVRERYKDHAEVLAYLDALQADVIEHVDLFRKGPEGSGQNVLQALAASGESPFVRYQVNVLVDNRDLKGAPVIVETNPTYHNLIGRIEHKALLGAMVTDYTMVKPGALHKANGGYLIIPVRECLLSPFAWDGLKRALKDRAVRIEELGAQLSLVSTVTLDPQPVPLDVKVILIGHPILYYLLNAYDEDFQKLFKVKADFTTQMDRTPEAERSYALFVSTITHQDKSLPFDRGAVARVIEYGSRLAGDQDKLSTRFGEIADLIREAAHRASQNTHTAVTADDMKIAEDARRFRVDLIQERLQEAVAKGTLLIETTGSAIGRVNGLSVLDSGDYAFGHPARITATVGPGRKGVISIEREVELSGPIHGKGVLILSGYLLQKYGQARSLNLSASLVFEQSYGMVEGDSASLAELFALISALSEIPLRQDIAMTGSVNQHGQVQPIGGATEKIEGFFDVCKEKDLTGQQGVLIPASNRRHLMLRNDVVEAVRAGQFHIWAVETVDEGLALLTGREPGELNKQGVYPKGSVHRAVADRLAKYEVILKGEEEKKRQRPGNRSRRK
jgi:lon-related putative ATP-dependent protease